MRSWIIHGVVWCVLAGAGVARADGDEDDVEAPRRLSAGVTLDWVSAYYFRGIPQETGGLILQPGVSLSASMVESDHGLTSLGASTGLWTSLHSDGQAGASGPAAWYEADYWATLSAGLGGLVGVDVTYTAYTSPRASFGTVHELSTGVALDDSGLFADVGAGRFAGLSPRLLAAFELSGQADGGDRRGIYLEASLSPELELLSRGTVRLAASVPTAMGLSARSYYEPVDGHRLGFMRTGLTVSLGFAPPGAGEWQVSSGVQALWLGPSTRGDHSMHVVGSAGLAVTF